jgi:hypothetical protein
MGSTQVETSGKCHFVILSEAKDLVFTHSYEILRSLCSLRMTGERTFAEVPGYHQRDHAKGGTWGSILTGVNNWIGP